MEIVPIFTVIILLLTGMVRYFIQFGRNEKTGKQIVWKKYKIFINLGCLLIAAIVST